MAFQMVVASARPLAGTPLMALKNFVEDLESGSDKMKESARAVQQAFMDYIKTTCALVVRYS